MRVRAQPVARGLDPGNKKKYKHTACCNLAHAQVYESTLSTSSTVEQLNSDIFVDKTFEWNNLLTWNIVYRAFITRGIQ